MRLIKSNIWKIQRVLHNLAATQEVPRNSRLHSRGSTRVPPTSRGTPLPPTSSRGGILSLHGRERIPGVPVASQEEALSTGNASGIPGSCHHSQSTQMSQSIPGKPVSLHCLKCQDEDLLTPRWHVGQPFGKASRESHRSLDPREGNRDTAATALRKPHLPAPTRDED